MVVADFSLFMVESVLLVVLLLKVVGLVKELDVVRRVEKLTEEIDMLVFMKEDELVFGVPEISVVIFVEFESFTEEMVMLVMLFSEVMELGEALDVIVGV